jgi:hypothetical protein
LGLTNVYDPTDLLVMRTHDGNSEVVITGNKQTRSLKPGG